VRIDGELMEIWPNEVCDNNIGIDSLFIDSLLKKNLQTQIFTAIDSTSYL